MITQAVIMTRIMKLPVSTAHRQLAFTRDSDLDFKQMTTRRDGGGSGCSGGGDHDDDHDDNRLCSDDRRPVRAWWQPSDNDSGWGSIISDKYGF